MWKIVKRSFATSICPILLIYTLIYSPLVPPPGPGVEPGGFIVPGGPGPDAPGAPGAPGVPGIPVRPGTGPPGGAYVPAPPQVSFPQPGQQYPK